MDGAGWSRVTFDQTAENGGRSYYQDTAAAFQKAEEFLVELRAA